MALTPKLLAAKPNLTTTTNATYILGSEQHKRPCKKPDNS